MSPAEDRSGSTALTVAVAWKIVGPRGHSLLMGCSCNVRASLVHVEVSFQDSLLHRIWDLGLLWHLADRRLHDGDTLGSLMSSSACHGWRAGNRATLSSRAEVLSEIVAFA